jgi:hypothetical protein
MQVGIISQIAEGAAVLKKCSELVAAARESGYRISKMSSSNGVLITKKSSSERAGKTSSNADPRTTESFAEKPGITASFLTNVTFQSRVAYYSDHREQVSGEIAMARVLRGRVRGWRRPVLLHDDRRRQNPVGCPADRCRSMGTDPMPSFRCRETWLLIRLDVMTFRREENLPYRDLPLCLQD